MYNSQIDISFATRSIRLITVWCRLAQQNWKIVAQSILGLIYSFVCQVTDPTETLVEMDYRMSHILYNHRIITPH